MGKIIFWIVIVFIVLFALRMWNVAKARARRGTRNAGEAQPMIKCVRCGVFLPQHEARDTPDGYCCAEPGCIAQRQR